MTGLWNKPPILAVDVNVEQTWYISFQPVLCYSQAGERPCPPQSLLFQCGLGSHTPTPPPGGDGILTHAGAGALLKLCRVFTPGAEALPMD